MPISLHASASLSILPRLKGLSEVLARAEAFADERKIDPAVLIGARLAPDMYPLSKQVQLASDHAKSCLYRIAGLDVPALEDNETSFADLKARVAKTVDLFNAVPAEAVNGRDDMPMHVKFPWGAFDFTGETYLFSWALPNFYFHVTTAYDILRHNGVALSKGVYMGRV
jgi:hypothetical protein